MKLDTFKLIIKHLLDDETVSKTDLSNILITLIEKKSVHEEKKTENSTFVPVKKRGRPKGVMNNIPHLSENHLLVREAHETIDEFKARKAEELMARKLHNRQ